MSSGPRITLPASPLRDGPTAVRRWEAGDVMAVPELAHDPEIVRWIGLSPDYSLDDARAFVETAGESARAGTAATFAVVDGEDALIGSVSLLRLAWADRRGEVGYWLGAGARGAGHMTRAVRLVCGWGFRELALERIVLMAAVDNLASQAVAERAGFSREARLRAWEDGGDFACFGRLATDPG